MRGLLRRSVLFAVAGLVVALTAGVASADGPGWETISTDFQGPIFGLNEGKGDVLLVADAAAGPTRLDPDDADTSVIASLPGVVDVIQVGGHEYLALTGEDEPGVEGQASLYRIKNGNVTLVANILDWELEHDFDQSGNNPEEDAISNPFDLARLGSKTLIADAAGNSIHIVDKQGNIEWVATLPYQDIETEAIKGAVGCPTPPAGLEFICDLPPIFTVDPVATTVDVGPDGYIYAGELAGFPGPVGVSRVWRIDPHARGVLCGTDDDDGCTLVNTGPLTSIIDIKFDGKTAYVVELDEAGWFLGESPFAQGGTVNACRTGKHKDHDGDDFSDRHDDNDRGHHRTVSWTCEEVATGLPFPTAVAIDDHTVYVSLLNNPETFAFEVAKLTNGGGDHEDGDGDDD